MDHSQPLDARTETVPLWRAITLGGRIKRRTGLLVLATAGVLAALALCWSWLVAAGLAPIISALAPCAAMCALGLCAGRPGEKDK